MKRLVTALMILGVTMFATVAFAAEDGQSGLLQYTVLAAALAIGLGTIGTGIGMGSAIGKACEGTSRNPEAGGKVLTTMIIGLAMIESLAIYALVVALLLMFSNPYVQS